MNAAFFDSIRKTLFNGALSQQQVNALEAIQRAWIKHGDETNADGLSYCFATALWEVGDELKPKSENLNYTSAERIKQVWPTRFATLAEAVPYVHNPQKLANRVYAGRYGNGSESSGDGYRYRGKGFAQVTFKDNYAKFGLADDPDSMLETDVAADALVRGCVLGLFTGKKLKDYFYTDGRTPLPDQARAIINADVAANGKKVGNHWRKFRAALGPTDVAPAPPAVSGTIPQPIPSPAPSGQENGLSALIRAIVSIVAAMFGRRP